MQRYNMVLVPQDEHFTAQAISQAQALFGPVAQGYLLGVAALPHVTLCQFYAPSPAMACALFEAIQPLDDLPLSLTAFHFREGTKTHQGFYWAEYLTNRPPQLLEAQKKAVSIIEKEGCHSLTSSASYAPHLTLARVQDPRPTLTVQGIFSEPFFCRYAVGVSTENGALMEVLA